MGYKCAGCKKRFSVPTGTVMESSKLPLQTWLLAFYRMATAKKGISSIQLAKELGITQKTAWFLQQRIREACHHRQNPMTGVVEVDEAYFGGKEHNQHDDKKHGGGRGAVGKQAVVGMKGRDGTVGAMPVEGTDKAMLHAVINEPWTGRPPSTPMRTGATEACPMSMRQFATAPGSTSGDRPTPTALNPSGHY